MWARSSAVFSIESFEAQWRIGRMYFALEPGLYALGRESSACCCIVETDKEYA
jgi:hypothetical protein